MTASPIAKAYVKAIAIRPVCRVWVGSVPIVGLGAVIYDGLFSTPPPRHARGQRARLAPHLTRAPRAALRVMGIALVCTGNTIVSRETMANKPMDTWPLCFKEPPAAGAGFGVLPALTQLQNQNNRALLPMVTR